MFKKLSMVVFIAMCIQSCSMEQKAVVTVGVSLDPLRENNYVHEKGEWTVMIYMPADNDMEKAALKDLNEMEAADFDFEKNHVVALVDCNQYMEGYEGEWNGTRLYEVKKDKNGFHNRVVSLSVGCRDLGLSPKTESELDMSDPDVLRKFVSSVKRYYPAEHYAFVMWGECSGYSGNKSKARALAFDDSNLSYMSNKDFALSLQKGMGGKFEILAMDSCFGSEIELLTEFEKCADYFIGMEGLQKTDGWDYYTLFSAVGKECSDGKTFGEYLLKSQDNDNVALVDLSNVQVLCSEFDAFSKRLAESVHSKSMSKSIKAEILDSDFCFTAYESTVNPVYVDIKSLARKYDGLDLISCIEKTSVSKNQKYGGIGVFFCNLDDSKNEIQEIPQDYVKSNDGSNCTFVENSENYVFTKEKKGTLLDKLFGNYSSF